MNTNQVVRLSFAPVVILVAVSGCFSCQRSKVKDSNNAAAAVVSIPNEGEIYLGTERLTLEQLGGRIQSAMRTQSPDEQVVYIKGSKHLTYGTVVDVIDAVVRLEQLERELRRILDQRPDKAVFIKAGRTLSYGDVAQIVDIVKSAGAQPIGLQIDYLQ